MICIGKKYQLKTLTSDMTRDRFMNILSFLHVNDNSLSPKASVQYDSG